MVVVAGGDVVYLSGCAFASWVMSFGLALFVGLAYGLGAEGMPVGW